MAHWVITDRGFGGQTYECSSCGTMFENYLYKVDQAENCPCCGEPIDDDENEYK